MQNNKAGLDSSFDAINLASLAVRTLFLEEGIQTFTSISHFTLAWLTSFLSGWPDAQASTPRLVRCRIRLLARPAKRFATSWPCGGGPSSFYFWSFVLCWLTRGVTKSLPSFHCQRLALFVAWQLLQTFLAWKTTMCMFWPTRASCVSYSCVSYPYGQCYRRRSSFYGELEDASSFTADKVRSKEDYWRRLARSNEQ